jgi:hypothetical protein
MSAVPNGATVLSKFAGHLTYLTHAGEPSVK